MRKINPRLLIGVLLAAFFAISLAYRILLPYGDVFVNEWIKFTSNDAYFHMRLVDNLVHNFPHLTSFDPYFIYPGGNNVGSIHFFDLLLSVIIWIAGLGSPTQHTIDIIGAYFPSILAALAVVPTYFIAKALFNRWAGVLAAGLVAVLPGEFLGRSIVAFTDHHAAETLFTTILACFFILAVKEAGQRGLSFSHVLQRKWPVILKPLIYSVLAGLFMGIYLITWQGAPLFIFIITLYFVIQFILSHLKNRSSEYLGVIGFVVFLVAAVIFLPISAVRYASIAVVLAMLIPLALSGLSLAMSRPGWKTYYYPVALVIIGAVFVAVFYAVQPQTFNVMLEQFKGVFVPGGATAATTMEMQPFLAPQGSFTTSVAWGNFTTSFFLISGWPIPGLALISFVVLLWLFISQRPGEHKWLYLRIFNVVLLIAAMVFQYFSLILYSGLMFALFFISLIWLAVKQRKDDEPLLFFLIWSLVILVITLVQRRFAYYLVINIAILSAYLSWQLIWLVGLKKLTTKLEPVEEPVRKSGKRDRKQPRTRDGFTVYHLNVILAFVVVITVVYIPNIVKSKEVASQAYFAPSDAWMASLDWMRENTPEPMGDSEAYYGLYDSPVPGQEFEYPDTAYGVAAWWDYGYWISRVAHRIPSTNPSQAPEPIRKVAELFLSQNETSANTVMDELEAKYLILDYPMVSSKYWAVVTWAEKSQDDFLGVYYYVDGGTLVPAQVYYPDYYRSTLVRLYCFDGQAVTEEYPVVLTYSVEQDSSGTPFRLVSDLKEFSSYQEAQAFVESEGADTHVIVGVNPFSSPVALEAVEDYSLIYGSDDGVSLPNNSQIPEIKIFEYLN
jgi:dolichyl-diphosphooligosaccharide--protein glycosyltransferase